MLEEDREQGVILAPIQEIATQTGEMMDVVNL